MCNTEDLEAPRGTGCFTLLCTSSRTRLRTSLNLLPSVIYALPPCTLPRDCDRSQYAPAHHLVPLEALVVECVPGMSLNDILWIPFDLERRRRFGRQPCWAHCSMSSSMLVLHTKHQLLRGSPLPYEFKKMPACWLRCGPSLSGDGSNHWCSDRKVLEHFRQA